MRDNKLLRIIYFALLFVISEIKLYYFNNINTVVWVIILSICFLLGIIDSGITIYKDYKLKKIGEKTYEEIITVAFFIVIAIILFVRR